MTRDYAAIWPIEARTASTDVLIDEAGPILLDMLASEGVEQAGPVAWNRSAGHLAATVRVHIDESDSPYPWESRRAWAEADLDGTARRSLLAEQFPAFRLDDRRAAA